MPFAETSLRDEYAAAVERVAGRTLDALRGVGGTGALADDPAPGSSRKPLLAAVRVLGPDLLAPRLLAGREPDGPTALLLAEAREAFPAPAHPAPAYPPPLEPPTLGPAVLEPAVLEPPAVEAADSAAQVAAWQDWATGHLLGHPVPPPEPVPGPRPYAWQEWSVRMARLSALALPGLDGPVHRTARAHTLDLSRGAVRSMLRRDHRMAARLTRWLAWSESQGVPLPLEVEPLLRRIVQVGDGSARTALELAIAARLSNGAPA
ncbi:hypothetical protein ACWEQL_26465 [Kitasatospora sp. NPDC004240]